MELNERQTRFLLHAFKAAPSDGISFSCSRVGEAALYDADESFDIAQQLAEKKLMTVMDDIGHLTPDGREEARAAKSYLIEIPVDGKQLGLLAKAYGETDRNGVFTSDNVFETQADKRWFTDNGLGNVGPTFGRITWTPQGLKLIERLIEYRKRKKA